MLSFTLRANALLLSCAIAILLFPGIAFADCPGVHKGAGPVGWANPRMSYAWPTYEKGRERVRLKNVESKDQVFINGCDAGKAKDMRAFYLDPGSYDLIVKRNGQVVFSQNLWAKNGGATNLNIRDK
jgi:hypothetical protein